MKTYTALTPRGIGCGEVEAESLEEAIQHFESLGYEVVDTLDPLIVIPDEEGTLDLQECPRCGRDDVVNGTCGQCGRQM